MLSVYYFGSLQCCAFHLFYYFLFFPDGWYRTVGQSEVPASTTTVSSTKCGQCPHFFLFLTPSACEGRKALFMSSILQWGEEGGCLLYKKRRDCLRDSFYIHIPVVLVAAQLNQVYFEMIIFVFFLGGRCMRGSSILYFYIFLKSPIMTWMTSCHNIRSFCNPPFYFLFNGR